jgi:hypothetical protein
MATETPGGKGIFTSEFMLAIATILSIIVSSVTGHTIDPQQLSDIVNLVIAYIAGRSAVKSIPQLLLAIVQAAVAKRYTNQLPTVGQTNPPAKL